MTKAKGWARWGARSSKPRLSCSASLTKGQWPCAKYRTPPCTSLVDREDVPWASGKDELNEHWRQRVKNDWLRLKLASLLIGTNSAARLDVADAVRAVTLGVLQANREFDQGAERRNARRAIVAELTFVEVYLDTAIAAARGGAQ